MQLWQAFGSKSEYEQASRQKVQRCRAILMMRNEWENEQNAARQREVDAQRAENERLKG